MVTSSNFSIHNCDDWSTNGQADVGVDVMLPSHYVLRDGDVLLGRGKKQFNHPGNRKLKKLVHLKLQEYITAPSKIEKSIIIREVTSKIRQGNSTSGFVKHDPLSGHYYDVGEAAAVSSGGQLSSFSTANQNLGLKWFCCRCMFQQQREKTSQAFRDAIVGYCKSKCLSKAVQQKNRKRGESDMDCRSNISDTSSSCLPSSSSINDPKDCVGVQCDHRRPGKPKQLVPRNTYPMDMNLIALDGDSEDTNLDMMKNTVATNALFFSSPAFNFAEVSDVERNRRNSIQLDALGDLLFGEQFLNLNGDPYEPIPIEIVLPTTDESLERGNPEMTTTMVAASSSSSFNNMYLQEIKVMVVERSRKSFQSVAPDLPVAEPGFEKPLVSAIMCMSSRTDEGLEDNDLEIGTLLATSTSSSSVNASSLETSVARLHSLQLPVDMADLPCGQQCCSFIDDPFEPTPIGKNCFLQ
jgi:hypothetical protein